MQRILTILLTLCLSAPLVKAQIKIGGNVYGGGNAGNLGGKTQVTIYAGDLNKVYGGARQADVAGSASVQVDGEKMSGDITINYVYGGNDIAGTIGKSDEIPAWVTEQEGYGIDNTYNTFVGTTPERKESSGTGEEQTTTQPYTIFIGQLFGGGNGDYSYSGKKANGKYDVTIAGTIVEDVDKPEVKKTFIDLHGGTFGYAYAGGNNATVTEAIDICINNHSDITHQSNGICFNMDEAGNGNGVTPLNKLTTESTNPNDRRLLQMGINLSTYDNNRLFRRIFGGNNKAAMHIKPTWHLHAGSIESIYSGGNEGDMTASTGLLLEIGEANMTDEDYASLNKNLIIGNVYGGCRKADVRPEDDNGNPQRLEDIQLTETLPDGSAKYKFPAGFSARVLVRGGDIGNVYGGNDITGNVTGGNAVGVYTSIRGDIYGGGNGSYAYTDNDALKDDIIWGDFYYNIPEGKTSVQALNDFRPNAEQVSIRVAGTETKPTIIGGSIFVGGNSATLKPIRSDYTAHLKIGSYVTADKVFLGNNGAGMVDITANGTLAKYAGKVINDNKHEVKFSSLDLTNSATFSDYMLGCAMDMTPEVVFDTRKEDGTGDPANYVDYSSSFGSFYCGGNVGSMIEKGLQKLDFTHKIIIFEKLVGGCNKAYVEAHDDLNAEYNGGLSGAPDENGNKLELNLSGLKIQPKRWKTDDAGIKTRLEWNTKGSDTDQTLQFLGGQVYGGCYESGHVNGNVTINILGSIVDRTGDFGIFADVETSTVDGEATKDNDGKYTIVSGKERSGVILDVQRQDVKNTALSVFGGGYGADSEIWGNTTINLSTGYLFKVFGGGELGAIGRGTRNSETHKFEYTYDNGKYSTTINVHGNKAGVNKLYVGDDLAEAEFVYGGGFEGTVAGNTRVNLGNGRVYNAFGGACNADILGHAETYVGPQIGETAVTPFPWIRNSVYGGNDLGGTIFAKASFIDKVREEAKTMVHGYDATSNKTPDVTKAAAYVQFLRGRVVNIFGGCYGDYDYATTYSTVNKPFMSNAFVHFCPENDDRSTVSKVFGAGQGRSGYRLGDQMQNRSYVLIDIPQNLENFRNTTEVFGAGSYNGLGMKYTQALTEKTTFDRDSVSAIVDLVQGQIKEAFGGSYNEGVTRRTVVNVPAGSTIVARRIFGGAYGADVNKPCDVFESTINYNSPLAVMTGSPDDIGTNFKGEENQQLAGGIYGGNNNYRRTLHSIVNINSKVVQDATTGYTTRVFGAGYGQDTWAQYTEVNLNNGANVYEVYGGGYGGMVLNKESVTKAAAENQWDLTLGNEYEDKGFADPLVKENELGLKCNANVYVKDGAWVSGYAYGGGLGATADVSGTVYFGLLGGEVNKDIYGSGTQGSVLDKYGTKNFVATTNVYVKGGQARNVFGSGWRGSVGRHDGLISDATTNDIPGVANVVVGTKNGTAHNDGIPSITRNVYGGGEGGAVYGTANVTINNGRIGFRYKNTGTEESPHYEYVAELDDEKTNDNKLDLGGNVFGGGYVANSYTDITNVWMWNGIVRGSLYGGGEIGPIGRGTVLSTAPEGTISNGMAKIYKGGETHVYLYDGHVMRDVFGGGRGYDNWGGNGWMTQNEAETLDLSSKGYVFGSTDVHIRGGEVGTDAGVLRGYGNVFGGGNEGFVFSATGQKVGTKVSDDQRTNGLPNGGGGYYYKNGNTNEGLTLDCHVDVEPYCLVIADEGIDFTAKQVGSVEVKSHYAKGEYVPVEALNQLLSKNASNGATQWSKVFKGDNTDGIVIHNAVFAGGNITEGSDIVSANTVTVYGNAAASVRDVYNRDLISLGTDDIGGIYGDGNLTLVDGFREIHIDNYGTDKYSLDDNLSEDKYKLLTNREKAYYKLKYVLEDQYKNSNQNHIYSFYESKNLHTYKKSESEQTDYRKGQKITYEAYNALTDVEKLNWVQGTKTFQPDDEIEEGEWTLMDNVEQKCWKLLGVCSIYAGRPMNTIQRADMCGVFGSRLVLKGAQDRVPRVVDYNNYTINRVDEVSLNKRESEASDEADANKTHGNYFGIYSVVNYLGNLTSDVFFTETAGGVGDASHSAIRTTDQVSDALKADGTTTYYQWKKNKPQDKYRNNGTSLNKVALASGVYLEIKREETETANETKWGLITGVVELDLINVMPGMGGGYVYAKNEHGTKTWKPDYGKVTLLNYNENARTYRRFEYNNNNKQDIETSGNFVHNVKQIVDDCYPNGGMYDSGQLDYPTSPAHYWFIKGSVYVYDQYISAYTGAANAYAEKVELPLTISAASNGKLTLREVQPNYYAYYDKNGHKLGSKYGTPETEADSLFKANNITYRLNDPISYWNYKLLTDDEKNRFVPETYMVVADCKVGNVEYKKGETFLPTEYESLKSASSGSTITYVEDDVKKTDRSFDYFFRQSNNLSHNTGYVLTFDINNPMVWDNYYTKIENPAQTERLNTRQYEESTDKTSYFEGPTYKLTNENPVVLGQRAYNHGDIIYGSVKTDYEKIPNNSLSTEDKGKQAEVGRAYIVTNGFTITDKKNVAHDFNPGATLAKEDYNDTEWMKTTGKVEVARVCTGMLTISSDNYVYAGKLLTAADVAEIKTSIKTDLKAKNTSWDENKLEEEAQKVLNTYIDDAYCCISDHEVTYGGQTYQGGLYGGTYFSGSQAYQAIDAWCSLSKEEREKFTFNYDALDLLIDHTYCNRDEASYGHKEVYDGTLNTKIYSVPQKIDYRAQYIGTETLTYTNNNGTQTITKTDHENPENWLSRDEYENIPNERHHYAPITIQGPNKYYVVKEAFMRGDIPYTTGQQIEKELYESFSETQKSHVDSIRFTDDPNLVGTATDGKYPTKTYFYCRQEYKVGEKGEGNPVTTLGVKTGTEATIYNDGETVPQGVVINQTYYDNLVNKQMNFAIHGTSPTEVSTLYVSSESDINNLQKEKIITVIYLYEYEESDESGLNVVPVSERHVVNIHINFKSGVPEIGKVTPPELVLPGTTVSLQTPSITQGAFRVENSGWELFTNSSDAISHSNGIPYLNGMTPMYWYQDGYYVAYYAETPLGKTYSKAVQFKVGNYHDLKRVMDDKTHHYYIDHVDAQKQREPKIYINDYSSSGENGLDLFRDLIDLTNDKDVAGHEPLVTDNPGKELKGGNNLQFFLRTDLDHTGSDWTPIGDTTKCFEGTLHGDGHTISGLTPAAETTGSLFGRLCGSVYNLGVTGSFTGGGVADSGDDGYVANCWVKTTGTPDKGVKAVFGNPEASSGTQVFNCYYPESNNGYTQGDAKMMPDKAFYNGTVTYNLNGYYLYKRYYDHNQRNTTAMGATANQTSYSYYEEVADDAGKLTLSKQDSKYGADFKLFDYVEDRYKDGDFIYAGGEIPTAADERQYTDPTDVTRISYYPIWPHDYLFFGQRLNYGHVETMTHQEEPSFIIKIANRAVADETGNRVFRAPAYFGSKAISMTHFNPYAVFAKSKNGDASTEAYKGMTAIDFTGGNGDVSGGYQKGWQTNGTFFPPLLDDGGLTRFINVDLTQNLLAYTVQNTSTATPAQQKTNTAVTTALPDETYAELNTTYNTVDFRDATYLRGHHVQQKTDGTYQSLNDHLLVDKQDFNAPIAYTFDTGRRMWYQRKPDRYVGEKKNNAFVAANAGWETVSLPFTAELVTTDTKGEITHFYSGNKTDNGTEAGADDAKVGHEYWLREFKGRKDGETDTDLFTAIFNYPEAANEGKTVSNTFLWDYYYHKNYVNAAEAGQDLNKDIYQRYYKESRSYENYPRLAAATPYIIGLPGERYYEFDLSGNWKAKTTAETAPAQVKQQIITFASKAGETSIGVSDDELAGVTHNGYAFKPAYMSEEISVGSYLLNSDGNAFEKTTTAETAIPFRPYFIAAPAPSRRAQVQSIVFESDDASFAINDHDPRDGNNPGELLFKVRQHHLLTTSTLRKEADVRIYNVGGQAVASFIIQPGETIETNIHADGVYIIHAANGQYTKKIAVK